MKFSDLRLSEPLLRAVETEGYTVATPIQAKAIPQVMEGRDVLGCAQTGTGKTAAFALPILHRLTAAPKAAGHSKMRCLVLCPTRELATQTADSFRAYGKNVGLRQAVIFGGVGQGPQVTALRQGYDIIVATPGRLMDLMNQGHADFRGVEVLVLDEADRMLDMGFINDIRKIVAKLPAQRQTLLFSATMPPEIRSLADALLRNPVNIQVAAVAATADNVTESVYFVPKQEKASLLAHLYHDLPMARTIVFTRTKRGADRVVKRLHASGIRAEAIHGDKSQNVRERALKNFKASKTPVLVATDIASRGIDVDGVTHVVNYDLTHEPETYVHRIGRTARAGAAGTAVSFCDPEEMANLRAIQKLIRREIPVKKTSFARQSNAALDAIADSGRPSRPSHGGKPSRGPSAARPSHKPSDGGRPAFAGAAGKPAYGSPIGRPAHGGPATSAAPYSKPARPAGPRHDDPPRAMHPLAKRTQAPGQGVATARSAASAGGQKSQWRPAKQKRAN